MRVERRHRKIEFLTPFMGQQGTVARFSYQEEVLRRVGIGPPNRKIGFAVAVIIARNDQIVSKPERSDGYAIIKTVLNKKC